MPAWANTATTRAWRSRSFGISSLIEASAPIASSRPRRVGLERLLQVCADAVVVDDEPGRLARRAVRLTRAMAWSSSASWMGRSRYITCSTGASKPVSSIDFTIRKASGLGFSPARPSGFLNSAMRASWLGLVGPLRPGRVVVVGRRRSPGRTPGCRMSSRCGRARTRTCSASVRPSMSRLPSADPRRASRASPRARPPGRRAPPEAPRGSGRSRAG